MSLPEEPALTGAALCQFCAESGTCCCKTDPALTHLNFPLSGPEWQRLLPYAHLSSEMREQGASEQGNTFRVAQPNRPEFIASMKTLFPRDKKRLEILFPSNGSHYILRTKEDGACVFLGETGCRLPRSVRPLYCLLFPVWMVEDSLTLCTLEHCLIAQKARSPAHAVALLEQHPALIRELHHALRQDWELAPQNNLTPSLKHL